MEILKLPNFENIYRVDKFDKEFQRLFGKKRLITLDI